MSSPGCPPAVFAYMGEKSLSIFFRSLLLWATFHWQLNLKLSYKVGKEAQHPRGPSGEQGAPGDKTS